MPSSLGVYLLVWGDQGFTLGKMVWLSTETLSLIPSRILNYFSLCTTNKERGRYVSGIGLVWGVGAILGPVVGGSFSDSSATWRWSFYINLWALAKLEGRFQ